VFVRHRLNRIFSVAFQAPIQAINRMRNTRSAVFFPIGWLVANGTHVLSPALVILRGRIESLVNVVAH
jgi:hypothetical protein